ncbi:selenocysteine lyase [Pseudonaja textilis]|uniref:selenocysteine lyase n=1 Tax=Pseudonaja textilis TaxID=8673 RepID=UPI000EA8D737|nr:selenocysteine lyase [Pseudonaja textilis]XP_026557115.1 selenocysteine lyase [Pseudonaja textilis]XP_026557116.1 selenocysteine lyase [Pseudonaja textilis]
MEETTLKMILVEQRTETNEKLNCNGKNNISSSRKIYMDYNATTPLAPEVIETVKEAMYEAWGNPSSSYEAGQRAKKIINEARESLAKMVGGSFQDIIFTSGGTEANNLVIHSAVENFMKSNKQSTVATKESHEEKTLGTLPHIIISCIEHDSVRLPVEHLVKEQKAEATFVPVSKVTGRVEVDDVVAAIHPTSCLVSVMLANNETGVVMPISELTQQIKVINHKRKASGLPWILVHTDAAQMIGKGRVDVQDLGVDYLTIVGHKFYAPRIGALYVRGLDMNTPLHPMLFGGGQEWSFRPGTENTPMIAGLGKAAELVNENSELYEAHMRKVRDYLEERLETIFGRQNINFNCRLEGSKRLCNTCNFSILGSGLQGWLVLSRCRTLLASVGAACHSEKGDQPSAVLLSCGIPYNVAQNAIRLSVGRDTSKEDVDLIVEDLKQAVAELQ